MSDAYKYDLDAYPEPVSARAGKALDLYTGAMVAALQRGPEPHTADLVLKPVKRSWSETPGWVLESHHGGHLDPVGALEVASGWWGCVHTTCQGWRDADTGAEYLIRLEDLETIMLQGYYARSDAICEAEGHFRKGDR